MKKLIFIVITAFFGSLTYASVASVPANGATYKVTCFSGEEAKIAELIWKAASTNTSEYWSGYDAKGPIVLLTSSPDIHPVLNVEMTVLSDLHLKYASCEDVPAFYAILGEKIENPDNKIYAFYKPTESPKDIISKIAIKLNRVSLSLSIRADIFNSPVQADFFARTAIHEGFHSMHQFNDGFKFDFSDFLKHKRDLVEQCEQQVTLWQAAVSNEMKILTALGANWYLLSDNEIQAQASVALKIRSQALYSDGQTKDCYGHFDFWERIEGVAHFVDLKVAARIGSFANSQIPVPDFFDGENGHFYFTGAIYCRILEKLYPNSDWQEKINQGESPAALLLKLLPNFSF